MCGFRMVDIKVPFPLTRPHVSCKVSLFKMCVKVLNSVLGTTEISRTPCNRDSKVSILTCVTEEGGRGQEAHGKERTVVWLAPAGMTQQNIT